MYGVFFFLLLSGFSFAQNTEKRFDFDKNGKPDFIEVYREGKLVETHYDSDVDGKFDRHTILDPESEVFKIIHLDKTKSQPRKRISFWNNELRKKTIAHFELDKNNDGIFEISYEMDSDIEEKRETCSTVPAGQTDSLAASALAACLRAEDYTQTDFGYRIHKSCMEGDRSWVLPMIRDSISQGRACLTRLSQSGMRGAARNLSSLESLLSANNVQILCDEPGYDWARAVAHATTGTQRAREDLPLVHPGISLGPDNFKARTTEGDLEFKRTLFHEQLHTLGNRHGSEPEISYTCEKCCFPGNDAKEVEAACKVCGGDYSSITDVNYLEDISGFAEASYSTREARSASLAYLKENPGDELGLAYLALNTGGIFGPVGNELAEVLAADSHLSSEERAVVERAQKYKSYGALTPYKSGGRIVAEAYVKLFRDGNPEEALGYLRRNANALKAQMSLRSGDNGHFMADNIKDNVDKLIFEVWIKGYRGRAPAGESTDSVGREAYELRDLLGLQ
jgi:hypothetical protein